MTRVRRLFAGVFVLFVCQNALSSESKIVEEDGIVIQLNSSLHQASEDPDDMSFGAYSLHDVFHPEKSARLSTGYVYLHATLTNTNEFPVSVSTEVIVGGQSDFPIAFPFLMETREWKPSKEAGMCTFVTIESKWKQKLIDTRQTRLFQRYFGFSLQDGREGDEIKLSDGAIKMNPKQSVLVKFFVKETAIPGYFSLMTKGSLPQSGCFPKQLYPELYDNCDGGKLDYYFFDSCTEGRNAQSALTFKYYGASSVRAILAGNIVLSVRKADDQPMITHEIKESRGMMMRNIVSNCLSNRSSECFGASPR